MPALFARNNADVSTVCESAHGLTSKQNRKKTSSSGLTLIRLKVINIVTLRVKKYTAFVAYLRISLYCSAAFFVTV